MDDTGLPVLSTTLTSMTGPLAAMIRCPVTTSYFLPARPASRRVGPAVVGASLAQCRQVDARAAPSVV